MTGIRIWLVGTLGAFVLFSAVLLGSEDAGAGATTPEPSLVGQVIDESGAPVAQQPVVIEGPEGVATSVTNSEGRFLFYNLKSGDYRVTTEGGEVGEVVFVEDQPWYKRIWQGTAVSDPAVVDLKIGSLKEKPGSPQPPGTGAPVEHSPE